MSAEPSEVSCGYNDLPVPAYTVTAVGAMLDQHTVAITSALLDSQVHPGNSTILAYHGQRPVIGIALPLDPLASASLDAYIRSQLVVKAALAAALAVHLTPRAAQARSDGGVWETFRVTAVHLLARASHPFDGTRLHKFYAGLNKPLSPEQIEQAVAKMRRLHTGTSQTAFDLVINSDLPNDDHVWYAMFRDGDLVDFSMDG